MKELSIKEKAKAYDEAREKIAIRFGSNVADEIFSQFEMSEDEKIRNVIYGWICIQPSQFFDNGFSKEEMLAWLEKQGEQKSKFRVGDTIKCKYDNRRFTIKSVDLDKGTYTYTQEGCGNDIDYADEEFELVEQKPAEWSDEDEEKMNWIIATLNNCSMRNSECLPMNESCEDWLKSLKDRVQPQPKQEWSEEDEEIIEALISLCDEAQDNIPQLSALKNWLKNLKDRVQPQPKQGEQNLVLRDTFGYEDGRLFGMNEGIGLVLDNPEKYGLQKPVKWSKEDESVISLILSICNDFLESFEISPASTKVVKEDIDKIKNWLKSLKDIYTWKPSDEQMKQLGYIAKQNKDNMIGKELVSLYNDLKKLREE